MTADTRSAAGAEEGRPARAPDEHLSHLIPALSKSLMRATSGAERMPSLESQVSILRKIVDDGPRPPAQLAEELFLSRPTISNLLRGLESGQLVTRSPSMSDGRSVVVSPTPYGREVLQQFRRGRREVLAVALAGIAAEDRERLLAALPILESLLERLVAMGRFVPDESNPDA